MFGTTCMAYHILLYIQSTKMTIHMIWNLHLVASYHWKIIRIYVRIWNKIATFLAIMYLHHSLNRKFQDIWLKFHISSSYTNTQYGFWHPDSFPYKSNKKPLERSWTAIHYHFPYYISYQWCPFRTRDIFSLCIE